MLFSWFCMDFFFIGFTTDQFPIHRLSFCCGGSRPYLGSQLDKVSGSPKFFYNTNFKLIILIYLLLYKMCPESCFKGKTP